MKTIFFILFVISLTNISVARNLVAVVDGGNWTDPATWGGFVPAAGDNIEIPEGITVEISSKNKYSGAAMSIKIAGTLDFVKGGAKLEIPCGSYVEITETGKIIPTGPGSGSSREFELCDDEIWEAKDGTLYGPVTFGDANLPVELISFEGFIEDNSVKLEWSTASEVNNDYFQVEKSSNGIDFEILTVISGNGNSNTVNDYYTYDDLPLNKQTMYYRLKQVDFDGKFEYSEILSVNIESEIQQNCKFDIIPNPCLSRCTIKLKECNVADNENFIFYIYDAAGNAVLASSPQIVNNGEARFVFDPNNKLKPGMYIIKGSGKTQTVEDKMIINN